ncbi:unnamed protein product [Linum trigynum]|uniref:Uncharacterized protein n=1 Tax=Linum trigynum TaxID=586398 RepID=A0AAV2CIF3_9ROSI
MPHDAFPPSPLARSALPPKNEHALPPLLLAFRYAFFLENELRSLASVDPSSAPPSSSSKRTLINNITASLATS